jgi:hypothetical protein
MYKTLHKTRKEEALDLFIQIKGVLKASGRSADEYVYIFPIGNFGEHTYTLGHLPALRNRFNVCLVLKESKLWLTEFFKDSYDFVVSVPDPRLDLYDQLFEISYLQPGFPYVVWSDLVFNGRFNSDLIRQGRLTLAESYAFALELPLDSPLVPLTVNGNNSAQGPNGHGHTLLIPNATTVKTLNQDFWTNLYYLLKNNNYSPIVDNTHLGWSIPGIEFIQLEKSELIYFVNRACSSVVGIRSGILDLIGGLISCRRGKKLISLLPVDSDFYDPNTTGLRLRGASKNVGLKACWGAENIYDVEVDLRSEGSYDFASQEILKKLK